MSAKTPKNQTSDKKQNTSATVPKKKIDVAYWKPRKIKKLPKIIRKQQ